jgi:hypothetical protein
MYKKNNKKEKTKNISGNTANPQKSRRLICLQKIAYVSLGWTNLISYGLSGDN